jgi:6-phosphogluconolactonase
MLPRSLGALLALAFLSSHAPAETFLYVSVAGANRIAVYKADEATGKLTHLADAATAGEPGALAVDPSRRFLFASLRSAGKISAFRRGPDGKLTHVNTINAAPDPAHLSTDATGRFLLTAYYINGHVTVHAIGKEGALAAKPVLKTSTAEKAHAIVPDRSNRFVFVAHTGGEAIFQFTFAPATGKFLPNARAPRLKTPAGTGPRHLVFHPIRDIAYVVNEQGGSVTAYALDASAGTLKAVQTVSTLPKDFKGPNACAEVRVHPTGKFLYASNRGHDSIACFALDGAGRLSPIGHAATERTPRSFDLSPDGRFLYAAGEGSGKLATFVVDGADGTLKRVATYEVGERPWWVLAVGRNHR